MSDILKPDICIIGAGSGGLSVAAIAASFNASVVLVEEGRMGGDCLNYGCVPSKALLAAARHAHDARRARAFGVTATGVRVDFQAVHDHVHEVIATIAPNDSEERFAAMGVQVIRARGRFQDARTLRAGDTLIRARRFVLATGSRPAVPAIPGLEEVDHLTNETVFDLHERPRHLVVLGGGPIGLELGQAFRRLGARVSVIEAEKALGRDDPEAAELVKAALAEEGVQLFEGYRAEKVSPDGKGGITVTAVSEDGERQVGGSHLLLALGRAPNVEDMGLEAAGVSFDRAGVRVDERLRTSNRRIHAIGDVSGWPQFTHVANYHAGIVIQNALFRLPARARRDILPWVIYTEPELAQVGLTEAAARADLGSDLRVLRWPLAENDRAQIERTTAGFIKLMADRRGRILGATIAGPGAGEMANMWSLAISRKLKVSALRSMISPYPTLSEIGKRAAITFYSDVPRRRSVQLLMRLARLLG